VLSAGAAAAHCRRRGPDRRSSGGPPANHRQPGPTEPAAAAPNWLRELRKLRDKAQSCGDAPRAEKLQAEIEELTGYLDEALEASVERGNARAPADNDKPR